MNKTVIQNWNQALDEVRSYLVQKIKSRKDLIRKVPEHVTPPEEKLKYLVDCLLDVVAFVRIQGALDKTYLATLKLDTNPKKAIQQLPAVLQSIKAFNALLDSQRTAKNHLGETIKLYEIPARLAIEEYFPNEIVDAKLADALQAVNAISAPYQSVLEEQKQLEERYNDLHHFFMQQIGRNLLGTADDLLQMVIDAGILPKDFVLGDDKPEVVLNLLQQRGKIPNKLMHEFIRRKIKEREPELLQKQSEIEDALKTMGNRLIDLAFQTTNISEQEAQQYIKEQVRITDAARQQMQSSGVSQQELDASLQDIFRMIGRLNHANNAINFLSLTEMNRRLKKKIKAGKRSFAMPLNVEQSDGTLKPENHLVLFEGRVVIFHELGHTIDENCKAANKLAEAFFRKRTKGQRARLLGKLTGMQYSKDEKAIPDDFVDPYVGKVYKQYNEKFTNEIISMGIERLADPIKAAQLALRDPEHLALILTILKIKPEDV